MRDPGWIHLTDDDLVYQAEERLRPHARRLLLAAADPRVTDARLGRRLRTLLEDDGPPVREGNVVNLFAYLEALVNRANHSQPIDGA